MAEFDEVESNEDSFYSADSKEAGVFHKSRRQSRIPETDPNLSLAKHLLILDNSQDPLELHETSAIKDY